ncbi:MAG: hypothetical protein UHM85_05710 [Acutalibacteraceae bacterium]|nr:hypothetical protein [Acutalibacteraceae bacterium]
MDNIKLKESPRFTQVAVTEEKNVKLSWTKVKGAEKYGIKRATSSKDGFETLAWIKKCEFVDENVPENVSCFYKITAQKKLESKKNSSKTSAVRAVIVSDISAPEELKVQEKKRKICLKWKKVEGADGYIVSKRNDFYSQMLPVARTQECKFTDGKIVSGQPYYYCVQAYKKNEEHEKQGNYSQQVSSVSLDNGAVVEAKALFGKKVQIRLRLVAGADGYILQRKDSPDGEFREVARSSANTEINFTDSVPKHFKSYFYRAISYKTVENKLYISEPTAEIQIKSK